MCCGLHRSCPENSCHSHRLAPAREPALTLALMALHYRITCRARERMLLPDER
ncbi:hypothetical protein [Coriobacterium glomerans]|uniref:hypothetical protein n=1 Tax=Coriobacterium glomerans TaxID=33871 RepID=UPI00155A87CD|nr:hypothetical protein [Coriobacterium glomerans]